MAKLLKLKEDDQGSLMKAHKIITQNPFKHFTIPGMATEAGINREKLTYGFKQLYGMGVYEYQVKLRMQEAELLLTETEHVVKRIAKSTGYKNSSSFCEAFKKKHNGVSPSQWRKLNKLSGSTNIVRQTALNIQTPNANTNVKCSPDK
jgi:AraC-like DNA-binding protein